jgi:hypothetical protein
MKRNVLVPALVGVCLLVALAVLVAPAAALFGGACCWPDGSCHQTLEVTCLEVVGAQWMGLGTDCAGSPCGPVGGMTEPLAASALVLPAVALAGVVAAGAATALLVRRRSA